MNKEQKFFKLLKYSNELEKNKKFLFKEDPEVFKTLSKFLIIIEENLHYAEKDKYSELIQDFLDDKINAEDFSIFFMTMYEGINQNLRQMIKDFKEKSFELSDFLIESKRYKIGNSLARVYGYCDSFNPDSNSCIADEEELRNCAQILLDELQQT